LDDFEEASGYLGYDLWKLVCHDEAKLNQTQYTQPALLVASIALWRIWVDYTDMKPAFVAGHSLGEYSACVASGILSFKDAVKIVALRGQLMQKAVPADVGAMAVVLGLDDEAVIALCQKHASSTQVIEAVNFNCPGQVVIAGHRDAVKHVMEDAKSAGSKRTLLLPVSVPSHCALMQGVVPEFEAALKSLKWRQGITPIIHNSNLDISENAQEVIAALAKQLYSPVYWTKTIEFMVAQSVNTFVECGPAKVLTGLDKRIYPDGQHVALSVAEAFDDLLVSGLF
jgi:[acyl-carrier-protein] S-malonyltransferase